MILAAHVLLVWFALSVPVGMLAGQWLRTIREYEDARAQMWYNACTRPGEEV